MRDESAIVSNTSRLMWPHASSYTHIKQVLSLTKELRELGRIFSRTVIRSSSEIRKRLRDNMMKITIIIIITIQSTFTHNIPIVGEF